MNQTGTRAVAMAVVPHTQAQALQRQQQTGLGALSVGGFTAITYAFLIGGGIGGGLLAARLSRKHQVGAAITGTLLGAVLTPMIGMAIVMPAVGGINANA